MLLNDWLIHTEVAMHVCSPYIIGRRRQRWVGRRWQPRTQEWCGIANSYSLCEAITVRPPRSLQFFQFPVRTALTFKQVFNVQTGVTISLLPSYPTAATQMISSLHLVFGTNWRAPWKNRTSRYISFFCPSLNGVLFLMFCLLTEGECQILVF